MHSCLIVALVIFFCISGLDTAKPVRFSVGKLESENGGKYTVVRTSKFNSTVPSGVPNFQNLFQNIFSNFKIPSSGTNIKKQFKTTPNIGGKLSKSKSDFFMSYKKGQRSSKGTSGVGDNKNFNMKRGTSISIKQMKNSRPSMSRKLEKSRFSFSMNSELRKIPADMEPKKITKKQRRIFHSTKIPLGQQISSSKHKNDKFVNIESNKERPSGKDRVSIVGGTQSGRPWRRRLPPRPKNSSPRRRRPEFPRDKKPFNPLRANGPNDISSQGNRKSSFSPDVKRRGGTPKSWLATRKQGRNGIAPNKELQNVFSMDKKDDGKTGLPGFVDRKPKIIATRSGQQSYSLKTETANPRAPYFQKRVMLKHTTNRGRDSGQMLTDKKKVNVWTSNTKSDGITRGRPVFRIETRRLSQMTKTIQNTRDTSEKSKPKENLSKLSVKEIQIPRPSRVYTFSQQTNRTRNRKTNVDANSQQHPKAWEKPSSTSPRRGVIRKMTLGKERRTGEIKGWNRSHGNNKLITVNKNNASSITMSRPAGYRFKNPQTSRPKAYRVHKTRPTATISKARTPPNLFKNNLLRNFATSRTGHNVHKGNKFSKPTNENFLTTKNSITKKPVGAQNDKNGVSRKHGMKVFSMKKIIFDRKNKNNSVKINTVIKVQKQSNPKANQNKMKSSKSNKQTGRTAKKAIDTVNKQKKQDTKQTKQDKKDTGKIDAKNKTKVQESNQTKGSKMSNENTENSETESKAMAKEGQNFKNRKVSGTKSENGNNKSSEKTNEQTDGDVLSQNKSSSRESARLLDIILDSDYPSKKIQTFKHEHCMCMSECPVGFTHREPCKSNPETNENSYQCCFTPDSIESARTDEDDYYWEYMED